MINKSKLTTRFLSVYSRLVFFKVLDDERNERYVKKRREYQNIIPYLRLVYPMERNEEAIEDNSGSGSDESDDGSGDDVMVSKRKAVDPAEGAPVLKMPKKVN